MPSFTDEGNDLETTQSEVLAHLKRESIVLPLCLVLYHMALFPDMIFDLHPLYRTFQVRILSAFD